MSEDRLRTAADYAVVLPTQRGREGRENVQAVTDCPSSDKGVQLREVREAVSKEGEGEMTEFEQSIYADLIHLAASIARRDNMPSVFVDDWKFCKTTPKKDICHVLQQAVKADEQCADWAYSIRQIARRISKKVTKCQNAGKKEGR